MKRLVLVLITLMPFQVMGADEFYECEIRAFHVLGDEGELQVRDDGYEGVTFRVDRQQNVIIGDKINTIYNVDVVASNPPESGIYSLVNYSRREDGQIRRLVTLTVQDYGEQKPFVLAEGNYIFTGLCQATD